MVDREATGEKPVATNRKARHEYTILDTFEAGIVLKGTEVKSLRNGKANVSDSYALLKDGELWLMGMHISPYEQASYANVDPLRDRKLLLHKKEIVKLVAKTRQKGLTLVPLRVYFKHNIAKIEVAIALGRKSYDRRQEIAKREIERDLRRKYSR